MTSHPCCVVFYHYVRPVNGAGIRGLTPQAFCDQLDALQAHGRIIGYPEFAAAVHSRCGFRDPVILLTFDDGVVDHRDVVFPELQRRGVSGVFFLNGDYRRAPQVLMNVHKTHLLLDRLGAERLQQAVAEVLREVAEPGEMASVDLYRYDDASEQRVKHLLNYQLPYEVVDEILSEIFARHLGDEAAAARALYLSPEDVAAMSAGGMTFGYHTRRHRVLSRLDEAAQRAELSDGVATVRALTNQGGVPFCYPYGHRQTFDATTIRLLGELGYETAFTTVRQLADPTQAAPFEIPRFDTRDVPPAHPMPAAVSGEARS